MCRLTAPKSAPSSDASICVLDICILFSPPYYKYAKFKSKAKLSSTLWTIYSLISSEIGATAPQLSWFESSELSCVGSQNASKSLKPLSRDYYCFSLNIICHLEADHAYGFCRLFAFACNSNKKPFPTSFCLETEYWCISLRLSLWDKMHANIFKEASLQTPVFFLGGGSLFDRFLGCRDDFLLN